ncbi:ABC transporter ATP-binding protein [candidate division KSB1 bacterium]|nr:ABC transporter ATP-binding protein [candidate division KSB1 bacterium]
MVTLKEVSKTYTLVTEGDLQVLRDINLQVEVGETIAIMGPSGSGKSTLLNLIGTLDSPTSGSIQILGQALELMSEKELAQFRNQQIGFIFQLHHLLLQLTVLENVLIPTLPAGSSASDLENAKELLHRVGLEDRMDQMPGVLSGGERQRVAVVRALINQPRLILADEPTGSLDASMAEQLVELLVTLNDEQGTGLIMVTHSEALASLMNRVYQLHEGALVLR